MSDFKDVRPFEPKRLEEERAKDTRTIFTVSMSLEEYESLKLDMKVLKQPKDSTALKQLWKIGRNVLHDQKTGLALRTILDNINKNKRVGITVYEPIGVDTIANVTPKNVNM